MPNEAKWWHDGRYLIGIFVIALTAAMDFYVLVKGLPPGLDNNGVSFILGTWHAMPIQVIQWMVGSSKSSERQTELLAQTVPATSPNVAQAATAEERK